MWTVTVIVGGVLVQDGCHVAFAADEYPVGALAADGAHPALRERVRAGRLQRRLDHTSMPSAVNTASKTAVNLLSRSRSRNRGPAARWSRPISRFRTCWAVQVPVGWAVTPAMWTWRVAILMKNGT